MYTFRSAIRVIRFTNRDSLLTKLYPPPLSLSLSLSLSLILIFTLVSTYIYMYIHIHIYIYMDKEVYIARFVVL
jgi:hypothetical protein